MALVLLATCCREIGETQEAYGYYSRAIQLDPNNSELLIARGMLMYGTDPSPAADFERAIRLGSRLVAPYFYLARHYLANNLFEKCRSMCERGLQCFASARAQSELWELLAISLTTLGCPERDIRLAFENSIRVDPSNVRARRNLEIFQAAVPPLAPQPENWEGGSESSLRAPAQEEKVWPEAAPLERRAMAML
jgi:tetratricopeptide (TPR) repeat protein